MKQFTCVHVRNGAPVVQLLKLEQAPDSPIDVSELTGEMKLCPQCSGWSWAMCLAISINGFAGIRFTEDDPPRSTGEVKR